MRKVNYAMIAMMAMGLAACSQDDDLTGLAGSTSLSGSVMTEISSSSSNAASTRFDGSTGCWEESDAIGVYLTDSDNSNILNSASNVEFTLTDGSGSTTGKFTNETGITYPNDGTAINFHCYYPYTDDMAQSYTLDISDQSDDYKAYELMYGSKSTTGTEVTNSGVSVSFSHLVAKATIYVTPPTNDDDEAITVSTVTISGLTATATFAPIGGTLTLSDTTGEITPQCTTSEGSTADYETYEAIILPDTDISNLCLKFVTSDGYTYVWEISDDCTVTKIDEGYEYIFNIGLGTAPSSSAGSGSDSGSTTTQTLTEITGEAPGTYTASYYMTDEENGDKVEIYSQAYTYDANAYVVDVEASDTDLGTVLSEYVATLSTSDATSSSLKTRSESEDDGYAVALRFTAGTEYGEFEAFTVPDEISTLMLICDDPSEQASITLKGITSPVLNNFYLYNLDITGGGMSSTNLVNGGDISGTIKFESCDLHEIYHVLYLSGNTSTSIDGLYFTDCFFLDCYSIWEESGSTTSVTNGINFDSCTVGYTEQNSNANICYLGSVSDVEINATDCTFHFYGSKAFYFAKSTANSDNYSIATFTNCVIANRSVLFFWVKTDENTTNSYYLSLDGDGETTTYTGLTYLESGTDWSDVFSEDEYTGDYTLADDFITNKGEVGDPRWYEEDESSDDSSSEE